VHLGLIIQSFPLLDKKLHRIDEAFFGVVRKVFYIQKIEIRTYEEVINLFWLVNNSVVFLHVLRIFLYLH
jgi:hypothetical protein